jgi:oxygen-independent coproporphyrinogen-3 oxidase
MDTLGIYVQVPFCASKCSFCNFSSKVALPSVFDHYCATLENEIAALPSIYAEAGIAPEVCDLAVDSLYFGGGTPSLLGAERLRRLVQALRGRFRLADNPEFTIEVTPGSADDIFCSQALAIGFDRLSIGAQSFDDTELSSTGRLHTAAETGHLMRAARRSGYRNISLDLIAGIPLQTEMSWQRSVSQALELKPEHISMYLFEIDEKSRLGAEILKGGGHYHASSVPGDDFMAAAYQSAVKALSAAGYVQYEISNFALPGFESRHNKKYWQMKPYLGLGAGAHSFDGIRRWANETVVEKYQEMLAQNQSPIVTNRELTQVEQVEEFFFLGLRQKGGVDLAQARRLWGGAALGPWESKIAAMLEDGLVERQMDRISLAEEAYLVSNEIFQEFLLA